MKAADVKERARLGEDTRTEFKSVANPRGLIDTDAAAKTLCALANSGGGDLFAGVEDDGRLSGVGSPQQADRVIQHLADVAQKNLQPSLLCKLLKVEVDGALVVVVRVPGFSPDRPFRAGSRYYVRDGNRSREATRPELVRILQSSTDLHFDEQPIDDATRDDLDPDAIRSFIMETYPGLLHNQTDRYLRAIKAIDPDGVPTIAGALLFAREPQLFLLDAYITVIRFHGTVISSEFRDRQEIRGRVQDQLEHAFTFLDLNVPSPSVVIGTTRRELGIPRVALREAVANALTHRDYRVTSQILIYVFDDRVEIINPAELLNQLTLDGIQLGGVSQRRNPYLAGALARLSRKENAGIGVPEMIRSMTDRDLPEPEFSLADGRFRVILRYASST
ncbi:ATP-binding protein [Chondromyces apiculatus]|uniref:Putative transcriptional regulator n=1 Tax=Chondromyces apiculatus DSM 436 TaxID=1192034 RepID=A0A017T439_9BACT|nr:ATP-binding protein [Chondromyces apiculatus]EYF03772.1 putative transcriptional regulator [Chondromyces apiculatus DSM 436]